MMNRTPAPNKEREEILPRRLVANPLKPSLNLTFTRTSPQTAAPEKTPPVAGSAVRRSIGEWEAAKQETKKSLTKLQTPPEKFKTASSKTASSASANPTTAAESPTLVEPAKPKDRVTDARNCLAKIKNQLGLSRNIKTEIKAEITLASEKLFKLVKEAESATKPEKTELPPKSPLPSKANQEGTADREREREKERKAFKKMLDDHASLIKQNTEGMVKLQEKLEKAERQTYASVVSSAGRHPPERTALHSLVVTATDEQETGEDVLNRIRKAVNAKEGGVEVEKIRKAKDRKVIMGFRNKEEREKVKTRLTKSVNLVAEDLKNKDPLVVLQNVLQYNTDQDILEALKKQNKDLLKGLGEAYRLEIAYRKRTRNPHQSHVVMRVSPAIWRRLTEAGSVHIEFQRIRVADQSPLVQCSLCLGYGHGRRFCQETQTRCSHCGGAHMKADCPDWREGAGPTCCNCKRAKMEKVEHNAFSQECPIKRKWDALARATTAYC